MHLGPGIVGAIALLAATAAPRAAGSRAAAGQPTYDKTTGKLTELTFDPNHNGASTPGPRWTAPVPLRSRIDQDEDGKIDRWEYYDAQGGS